MVTGAALLAPAAEAQNMRRRAFGCSDRDAGPQSDPSWAHGADKDSGPEADPVLRNLYQDSTDRGGTSDAGSHRRGRPPVRCPAKREEPARLGPGQ